MSWKIGMPNLGHTMEEGTVSEWLKRVGDQVAKGEVIAMVESDKATFDIESPADGMLLAINADKGAVVPVGATIAIVGAPGEAAADEPARAPATRAAAPAPGPAAAPAPTRPARVKISPAARALAEELGVDPLEIVAADGEMITRDDVRVHAAERSAGAKPAQAVQPVPAMTPARRAAAVAAQEAWRTIPHAMLQSHADVSALVRGGGANVTAVLAKAAALALRKHPSFNGWLIDDAFEPSPRVDIGIGVATPDGLMHAVVSDVDGKPMAQLRNEIGVARTSARTGRLDVPRAGGASFTLVSVAPWGMDAFAPIIAAPQVAVLGVGRSNRVARETADGALRFASEVVLTLVFDHRANDAAAAADLLGAIVNHLEDPQHRESRA